LDGFSNGIIGVKIIFFPCFQRFPLYGTSDSMLR